MNEYRLGARSPWLKPAAKNKMFNAELVVRRSPGSLVIPTGYPTDYATTAANYGSVEPLLVAAGLQVELVVPEMLNVARSAFNAWIGAVDPSTFLKAIEGITWITRDYYLPDKAFLQEIAGAVDRWVVIAPQTDAAKSVRTLPGIGPRTVFKRAPKPPQNKLWGEPTDRKHRPAAQFIAGAVADYDDPVLAPWKGPNSGAVLIYPMTRDPVALSPDPERKEIVLAVAWITPANIKTKMKEVVQFRAKNSALAEQPIVPAE